MSTCTIAYNVVGSYTVENLNLFKSEWQSEYLARHSGNRLAQPNGALDDYLDGQIITVLAPQPVQLKDPDEREVEERQGHGPVSRFTDESRKGWSRYPDDILGTHKPPFGGCRWPYAEPVKFGHSVRSNPGTSPSRRSTSSR